MSHANRKQPTEAQLLPAPKLITFHSDTEKAPTVNHTATVRDCERGYKEVPLKIYSPRLYDMKLLPHN
jgi:hypothetical protein